MHSKLESNRYIANMKEIDMLQNQINCSFGYIADCINKYIPKQIHCRNEYFADTEKYR